MEMLELELQPLRQICILKVVLKLNIVQDLQLDLMVTMVFQRLDRLIIYILIVTLMIMFL